MSGSTRRVLWCLLEFHGMALKPFKSRDLIIQEMLIVVESLEMVELPKSAPAEGQQQQLKTTSDDI